MNNNSDILLTGASGFLGWTVAEELARKYRVIGTENRLIPSIHRPYTPLQLDLSQLDLLPTHLEQISPRAIVHTAAISSIGECERDPIWSRRINVESSTVMAEWARKHDIPFLFTSSDMVFDGKHAPYAEDSPPSPIHLYGCHKTQAEKEILAVNQDAKILRLPLLYGPESPRGYGATDFILKHSRSPQGCPLFTNEFRTPASTRDIAIFIAKTLHESWHGFLHLGGKEKLSRYEFGEILLEVLHWKDANITPALSNQDGYTRPENLCLTSNRAYSMGYEPFSLREAIRRDFRAMI